ncbi:MAG TPA: MoaD/ThiS family protein [Gemmatimonadota bacterium]|nr:MoaD/ThiS family protein [Gemmatimonadota bacterium]
MSDGSRVLVRLFGPAREAAGAESVELELPSAATAGDAVSELARTHPELAPLLPRSRVAVNLEYVDVGTPVASGDEIAILPPVGGG